MNYDIHLYIVLCICHTGLILNHMAVVKNEWTERSQTINFYFKNFYFKMIFNLMSLSMLFLTAESYRQMNRLTHLTCWNAITMQIRKQVNALTVAFRLKSIETLTFNGCPWQIEWTEKSMAQYTLFNEYSWAANLVLYPLVPEGICVIIQMWGDRVVCVPQ